MFCSGQRENKYALGERRRKRKEITSQNSQDFQKKRFTFWEVFFSTDGLSVETVTTLRFPEATPHRKIKVVVVVTFLLKRCEVWNEDLSSFCKILFVRVR